MRSSDRGRRAVTRLLLRSTDGKFTETSADTLREGLQSALPSHGLVGSTVEARPLYNDLLRKLRDHFTGKGCDASAAEVRKLEALGWAVIDTPALRPSALRALSLHRASRALKTVPGIEVLESSREEVRLAKKKLKECLPLPDCQLAASAASRPPGIGAGSVRPQRGERDPLVIDVEQGWAFAHKCVKSLESKPIHGQSTSKEAFHGTAVLSILAAEEDCGHFGLAPGVRIHLASIRSTEEARDEVSALAAALLELEYGDVLVLEFQHRKGNLPAELFLPVFHLVRAATNCGVVVVEAAGNGKSELGDGDWPAEARSSEGGTDSGAILVGGSTNPKQNGKYSRWSGSNHGQRIKVFAWAEGILVAGPVDGNQQCFDGTSAAAAIVAGCAVVAQRLSLAKNQKRLSPSEMRDLLECCGRPVKARFGRVLGVVPDLEAIKARI